LQGGRVDLGMQVADGYRGRGIGTILLGAVTQWARENDAHKVTLQVWPHNDAARHLYERFGFREEGRLRRHYRRRNGELWDAIIMGLVLDETSPGSRFAEA
jgi:RimJ/RimL family protein N-acetyltransferase